jgi:hypothetical protein
MTNGHRPEDIIGEWGLRDVTPPSQKERRQIEADQDLNPLVGKPLRRRLRNFSPEADSYLASLGGPLPYMKRLYEIERLTEEHLAELTRAYERLRDDADAWHRLVERWDFTDVNDLIDRHNRWFPTEARLRMDPRTRDYIRIGGRPYQRDPLDADWIRERFP